MRLVLPGQLKGPECREVIKQSIFLRKTLEPLFQNLDVRTATEIAIVLRIDGSLGSFGPEGVENINVKNGKIGCDLVIRDHGWGNLSASEIREILKGKILYAISKCFEKISEEPDISKVRATLSNDL